MRDNVRGAIADPAVLIPVETARSEREVKLYIRVTELEGVLERLFARVANAKDLADVNIAAGRAAQELAGDA